MATLPQRFGRGVRRLREAAGYSQERFAALARIDRAYYSRIERGHTDVSLEVVGRIAKALKVSLCELVAAVDAE